MRMLAEVCDVGVVLPEDGGAAVVLGAAMLGRLAQDVTVARQQGTFVGREEQAGRLWDIMVRVGFLIFDQYFILALS